MMDEFSDDNRIDEGPLESDLEELGDPDDPGTEPCSACGAEIYHDSVQCPVCGQYVFGAAAEAGSDRSTWLWVLTAIVVLAAFLWYVLSYL